MRKIGLITLCLLAIFGLARAADVTNIFQMPATTCTNQFVRSIATITGVGTCGSVAAADLPTPAILATVSQGNPTGTTSATAVMMGLGTTCTITPTQKGRVQFSFNVDANASVAMNGNLEIRTGTGAAPANGAAVTGTSRVLQAQRVTGVSFFEVVNLTAAVSGLTPSTAVWFDIALTSDGTNTFSIVNPYCTAFEF
jgi:hypothetical protein